MKKLLGSFVLSLFLSSNAFSEIPKFFGIYIGGPKAADLLKNDLIFVKESKKEDYGTYKKYVLKLQDPGSDYFNHFNYGTIKLDSKFEKRLKTESEVGYSLWAEGKTLYDTYDDCVIYRKGFLNRLNNQYNDRGYISEIGKTYKEHLTLQIKSQDSKIDRQYTIWTLCATNDGGGLYRTSGKQRTKETTDVKSFLIVQITDDTIIEIVKELYRRYKDGKLENPNTDGF